MKRTEVFENRSEVVGRVSPLRAAHATLQPGAQRTDAPYPRSLISDYTKFLDANSRMNVAAVPLTSTGTVRATRDGWQRKSVGDCNKMVGWLGLEPRTNGLKGRCSTD